MKPARVVRREGGPALAERMRAVLADGKPFRFRARGLSMSPFIKDGDVLTMAPLAGGALRTGDIAAFPHPATGRVTVHRVVRERAGLYDLKGDNADEVEQGLARERILGLVVRVERDGATVRLGGRGDAVVAKLSRSGLLRRAVGAARRAGVLSRRRG
jgi:hypothetical protein